MSHESLGADPVRQLRHNLANPLAAILAETQLLLMDDAKLDPEVVEALRAIETQSRRMRDILDQAR